MRLAVFLVAAAMATSCAAGCAAGRTGVAAGPDGAGVVAGTLSFEDGSPAEGAEVYFYTDPERKFRGPADFMAEPTGPDGRYMTELPPGVYYAVARKRASGEISGGLRKGDFYSREAYGPIRVKEGAHERVDLALSPMTGNMLLSVFTAREGGQGIKGVIRGRDGSPKAGAYAFAYKDPRMAGKPDYVSGWTREDGAYVIYVLEPGRYYVGARTGFMGVPRPDEPYGRYEGARDHSVAVAAGSFAAGTDITLTRFSEKR